MTTFEALCRYYSARNAIKADYDALTRQQRTGAARSERIRRIRTERTALVMQGKVGIWRMGLTADQARQLDPEVFACQADRHRNLEAVSVRKV